MITIEIQPLHQFYGLLTVGLNYVGWHDLNELFTYMFGQPLKAYHSQHLAYSQIGTRWICGPVRGTWRQQIDYRVAYTLECTGLDIALTEQIRLLGVDVKWNKGPGRRYMLDINVAQNDHLGRVPLWLQIQQMSIPSNDQLDESIHLMQKYDSPKVGLRLETINHVLMLVSEEFMKRWMPMAWSEYQNRNVHQFSRLVPDGIWQDDGNWIWRPLDNIWVPTILERLWRLDRLKCRVLARLCRQLKKERAENHHYTRKRIRLVGGGESRILRAESMIS